MTWVPCKCGDYWCDVHDQHAHDCPCPPIEEWETSPYQGKEKPPVPEH